MGHSRPFRGWELERIMVESSLAAAQCVGRTWLFALTAPPAVGAGESRLAERRPIQSGDSAAAPRLSAATDDYAVMDHHNVGDQLPTASLPATFNMQKILTR